MKGPRSAPKPVSPREAKALRDRALQCLKRTLELGNDDFAQMRKDPDLAPLRVLPEFEALLKEWEEKAGDKGTGEGNERRKQ